MAIQNLYPSIRPTLSLDFANTKRLDSRITFTRSTGATYYDGKTVAKAEENLLTYSQEFDNSYWLSNSLANGSISTNTVETLAPDGTNTADKFVGAATSSVKRFGKYWNNAPIIWSGTGTFSVFAKYGNSQYFHAVCTKAESGGYYGRIVGDLQNGTITDSSGVSDYGVQNVGNGWYRFWFTFNHSSAAFQIELGLVPNSSGNAYDGNGRLTTGSETPANSNFYIWGAQLEQRSSVTAYTPTTSQPITNYIPVLQSAAANVARFDHDPVTGESKGLLIEEQRSNLLTYSEDFSNEAWIKQDSTITANTVIAPDGTLTGDTVALTADVISGIYNYAASAGTFTLSIFAKAKQGQAGTKFRLISYSSTDGGSESSYFTLSESWQRFSWTRTVTAGTNWYVLNESGGGAKEFYIWGAQLEAGAFPTSYIKTEASQVTRAADVASMTGTNFSSWYNALNGVFYYDFADGNVASHAGYAPYDTFIGAVTNGVRNGYMDSLCYIGGWTVRSKANPTFSGYLAPQSGTYVTTTIANFKVATFATRTAMGGVANGGSYVSTAFTSAPSYPPNMLYINPALNGHLRKIA